MSVVLGAALPAAASAVGPADVWLQAILGNGEAVASNNVDGKIITARCVGATSGGHQLVYEVAMSQMGQEFINLNPGEVDFLMWVDGHGGVENDRFRNQRASVSFERGKFRMTVSGEDAWDMLSWISQSDWVTVAVTPNYEADPKKMFGITSYRTYGTAETALRDLLAQCAPKG